MRVSKVIGILAMLISFYSNAQDPAKGKTLFDANCMACHSIGGGKIVGPDLKDVDKRRTQEWILKFVKHPMTIINSGDAVAKKLFEDHGKIPMPDQAHLKDEEIKHIIAYIHEKGAASATPAKPKADNAKPKTVKASVTLGFIEYTLMSLVGIAGLVFVFLFYMMVKVIWVYEEVGRNGF